MMRSSISVPKARTVIATTVLAASSYSFVEYRAHDERAISTEEVSCSRGAIAYYITPSALTSRPISPTTTVGAVAITPQTDDALASQHLQNLTNYGTTVIASTLSPPQLVEWNRITKKQFDDGGGNSNIVWQSGRAHCHISKNSIHYNKMTRVGCNTCDDVSSSVEDKHSSWRWGDLWRRRRRPRKNHTMSRNDEAIDDESLLASPSPPPPIYLHDIVQAYFQQHGIQRYMLTDIQFLNAYPQSTNQIWHRDNTRRGLTAIVSLCNIRDNGPTELILGSHQSNFSVWSEWRKVIQKYLIGNASIKERCDDNDIKFVESEQPPLVLLGCIDAGDALLYDARIFHRGRGYENAKSLDGEEGTTNGKNDVDVLVDRPVLVLRWDAANTPPPGAGIIVTSVNAYVGSMMYASLSVLGKIIAYYSNE